MYLLPNGMNIFYLKSPLQVKSKDKVIHEKFEVGYLENDTW